MILIALDRDRRTAFVLTQVIVPHDPGAAGLAHTAQSNGLKITFGE